MSKRIFTQQEIARAAAKLPSPYAHATRAGRTHRVAVMQPLSALPLHHGGYSMDLMVPVMDFELDTIEDSNGHTWKRWVFNGTIAV